MIAVTVAISSTQPVTDTDPHDGSCGGGAVASGVGPWGVLADVGSVRTEGR